MLAFDSLEASSLDESQKTSSRSFTEAEAATVCTVAAVVLMSHRIVFHADEESLSSKTKLVETIEGCLVILVM